MKSPNFGVTSFVNGPVPADLLREHVSVLTNLLCEHISKKEYRPRSQHIC